MLGPVDFRSFAEDRRAALGDEEIGGDTEGGVGGDAGVAVGAAAIGAENQMLGGELDALNVIDARQQLGDRFDASLDSFGDAAAFLNGQNTWPGIRGLP